MPAPAEHSCAPSRICLRLQAPHDTDAEDYRSRSECRLHRWWPQTTQTMSSARGNPENPGTKAGTLLSLSTSKWLSMQTSRSPPGTGTGLYRTAFTSVKTIVFRPIPVASVAIIAAENHRCARIPRTRVSKILRNSPQPPSRPLPFAFFARRLHAAKLDQCLSPRLRCGHTLCNLRRNRLLQVKPQLLVKFAPLLAEQQKPDARQQLTNHRGTSTVRPRTSPIAADSRSHVSSSLSSCLRPAAVSR